MKVLRNCVMIKNTFRHCHKHLHTEISTSFSLYVKFAHYVGSVWQTDLYRSVIRSPFISKHFNDDITRKLHLIFKQWTRVTRQTPSKHQHERTSAQMQRNHKHCGCCYCPKKKQQQTWLTDANAANHRRDSAREAGLMRFPVQSKTIPGQRLSVSHNSPSLTGSSRWSVLLFQWSCVLFIVSEMDLSLWRTVSGANVWFSHLSRPPPFLRRYSPPFWLSD